MLLLLRHAELYDPAPQGRRNLLVAGERVVWIGRDIPALDRALGVTRKCDLGGRRVIPGLIDGHVHLTGGGGEAGPQTRVPPLALSRLTSGGVTTAVGVLGTDDTVRTTAELVTVARGLSQEGLTRLLPHRRLPRAADDGHRQRPARHRAHRRGARRGRAGDQRSPLQPADARRAAPPRWRRARRRADEREGRDLHLHVGDGDARARARPPGAGAERAAAARLQPHAREPRSARCSTRRSRWPTSGCTVDLTAFPVAEGEDAWSAVEATGALPRRRAAVGPGHGELGRRRLLPGVRRRGPGGVHGRGRAVRHGRHAAGAAPLRAAARAGAPAFTSNPARLLRLERKGRLVPGADADLVVLDNDGTVADVLARGRWHVRSGLPLVRGTFERAE